MNSVALAVTKLCSAYNQTTWDLGPNLLSVVIAVLSDCYRSPPSLCIRDFPSPHVYSLHFLIPTPLTEILRSIGEVSEYSIARIVKAHEAKIKTMVSSGKFKAVVREDICLSHVAQGNNRRNWVIPCNFGVESSKRERQKLV